MLEKKIYKLKEEFFPLLNISIGQYKRRKEDLLKWLTEFYDYEILEGKPIRIKINEVYGEYVSMPRNIISTEQKEKDYEEYVKANLPKDFQPESKAHMARGAINLFGYEKYNHSSDVAVARRYVGPAMEKYGEKSKDTVWVDYKSYQILSDEILQKWRSILKEEHISEEVAASAWYMEQSGQDTTKEKKSYKAALERAKTEMGIIPIKVSKWKNAGTNNNGAE